MKLLMAYVCADCEEVLASSKRCPSCAGSAVYPLLKALGRAPLSPAEGTVKKVLEAMECESTE